MAPTHTIQINGITHTLRLDAEQARRYKNAIPVEQAAPAGEVTPETPAEPDPAETPAKARTPKNKAQQPPTKAD